jgi:hypothetical protein
MNKLLKRIIEDPAGAMADEQKAAKNLKLDSHLKT